jgi:hypothetical protein
MTKMNRKYLFFFLTVLVLTSCNEKKKQLSFYDNSDIEDSVEVYDNQHSVVSCNTTEEVSVPFIEQGGIKLIDVTVNRQFTIKMILDSGCSGTLISIAEANYLYEKGCITQDDILGMTQSQIADGSIVENMVINLRELVIGGQIACSNVTATVSANAQAPLLLGNEVLNRAPSYSVDNQNKVIRFQLEQ